MDHYIDIKVLPDKLSDIDYHKRMIAGMVNKVPGSYDIKLIKRSIDARKSPVYYQLRYELHDASVQHGEAAILEGYQPVFDAPQITIIGAGPAGYFAALDFISLGYKPVLFDRGKDVQTRRRDLKAIQQYGIVNPDSNYCYGEGGAGTYSDGKLYTRSTKRGDIIKSLQLLVEHGAPEDILIDAHPHIGSNKLPQVVSNIRESILKYGGEVHFDSRMTDLIIQNGKVKSIVINDSTTHDTEVLVLATGHSARDVFTLLKNRGVRMEAKAYALGVRIEHPQSLIDGIQYKQSPRDENLPPSSYKLVCQVKNKGVFSFCMCPGGLIVPSATAPGEIVVNGMSMSRRDSAYANSGTVVGIEPDELAEYQQHGAFCGLEFQKEVEQSLFNKGDGSQKAPGQRLTDFYNMKQSKSLPGTSYIPGVYSAPLHEWLPARIQKPLKEAIKIFGQKMRGYYTEEALIVAPESRTSSPVRIPRDKLSFMHPEVEGLFPCGEGAGYAGGIISAAMDGQAVAKAAVAYYQSKRKAI